MIVMIQLSALDEEPSASDSKSNANGKKKGNKHKQATNKNNNNNNNNKKKDADELLQKAQAKAPPKKMTNKERKEAKLQSKKKNSKAFTQQAKSTKHLEFQVEEVRLLLYPLLLNIVHCQLKSQIARISSGRQTTIALTKWL